MKTSVVVIAMFALIYACTKSKTLSKAEEEALIAEAQKITTELFNKMEANDTAALFTFFSRKPGATMIMGDQVFKQEDFMKMARGFLGDLEKQTLENGTRSFTILDPTTFVFSWKGLNKAYQKSGAVTIWDPIVVSYIFQKEETGWKIIYGHEGWTNMKVDSSMVKK